MGDQTSFELASETGGDFAAIRRPPAFREGRWAVSPLNFEEAIRGDLQLPERVTFMDMTLGRGIQLPGVGFTLDDQVEVATALADAGVPEINPWVTGQPTATPEAIRALTRLDLPTELICFLAVELRASRTPFAVTYEEGIDLLRDLGVRSVEIAMRPLPGLRRVQSLVHSDGAESVGRQSLDDLIDASRRVVDHAKRREVKIRVNIADAAQTNFESVVHFARAVSETGADVIGVGDHNGLGPAAFRHLFAALRRELPDAVLAVHTHNQVGLAIADAIAAVEVGAQVVDVSVNAMASTGGQADLAAMASALEAFYGISTGVRLERLTDLYTLVERASGYPVHPLAPVVGRHAYSPIGIALEELDPYVMNPILPQTVGNRVVFSPNLCMEDFAVERKLRELGLDASPDSVAAVADALKERLRVDKVELDDDAIRAAAAEVERSVAL